MSKPPKPFWEVKTLDQMSAEEWESLCDRCGRCCLLKFEDKWGMYYTDVGCRLLDLNTGSCSDYPHRQEKVAECFNLTPADVREGWLPATCAYRRVDEGKPLYWWHPLISGDLDTVRMAGIAVAGRCRYTENDLSPDKIEQRERSWPNSTRAKKTRLTACADYAEITA